MTDRWRDEEPDVCEFIESDTMWIDENHSGLVDLLGQYFQDDYPYTTGGGCVYVPGRGYVEYRED